LSRSLEDEALTAVLRLRRDVIARRHAALLEEMACPQADAAKAAGLVVVTVIRGLRSKASDDLHSG
jgi:hypothetical protein